MVELARTYRMPAAVHLFRHVSRVLARAAIVCGFLALAAYFLGAAHDEGVFGFEGPVGSGINRFLETLLLVALFGGVAAPLLLALVTRYVQHTMQRSVLNQAAADQSLSHVRPVSWQLAALRGERASVLMLVLGWPMLLFFGFFTAVAASLFNEPDVDIGNWIVFGAALALTVIGLALVLAGKVRVRGPAVDLWGRGDNGYLPRERGTTGVATGPVVALEWMAGTAGWLTLAVGVPTLAVLASAVTRKLMPVGVGALVLLLVLLLASCAFHSVLSVRLRPTLLTQAANPTAPAPPWLLLRSLLLEEVPRQELLGSVHTAAVICLAVGAAGLRTGPEYPLADVFWVFQLLTTVGGILLLWHASTWFRHRARTRAENDYLLRRWP